jgi:hypothetical protein
MQSKYIWDFLLVSSLVSNLVYSLMYRSIVLPNKLSKTLNMYCIVRVSMARVKTSTYKASIQVGTQGDQNTMQGGRGPGEQMRWLQVHPVSAKGRFPWWR